MVWKIHHVDLVSLEIVVALAAFANATNDLSKQGAVACSGKLQLTLEFFRVVYDE